jgi:gliding motility-associated-like protein
MKSKLLSRIVLCCLVLLGLSGTQRAFADHLAAVDLNAEYIGTGPSDMKYRIVLKIYKICEPDYGTIGNYPNGPYTMNLQLFPTNSEVVVMSTTGNFNIRPTMEQVGPEDTLDQLCGTYKPLNSCRQLGNFVLYPGFLRRTYVDTVTVPSRTRDLRIYWSSCCRNAGVANLTGAASAGIYVECGLDNVEKYDNSTPVFTADPIPYICANRVYNYVNAPSDKNLDSLKTFNINPQALGFPNVTNLPYASGYTLTNPIGAASPGYLVNPLTGTATFNPQNVGKYVLAFRTEDYDKVTGKKLGWASRDVQVSVLPCAGVQDPTIDSIVQNPTGLRHLDPTIGNNILYVCPGTPISFEVNAHVNNANGVIILRPLLSSILPAGLTYTTVGNYGTTAKTTFNWTPTPADFGDHVIAMEALDSGCAASVPIVPKVYFVFTIRVLGPGLDAGPDLLVCPLGERPVKLRTMNGSPDANYSWTNTSGAVAQYLSCTDCPNPLANPPMDYNYVVTTDEIKQACKSSDTVLVAIDTSVHIEALQDPLLICRPAYVTLLSQAFGPAPRQNIPCGFNDPVLCNAADEDTAMVGFGDNYPTIPSNTPFFSGNNFVKYQFIIPKADLLKAGLYSGSIKGMAFQVLGTTINGTNPIENFFVSLACIDAEEFVAPANNNTFYPNVSSVSTYAPYTLTANSWNQIDFAQPYSWDTTKNLLVDICMGPTTPNVNGNDIVAMVPGSAIQKFSNSINVCGGNAPTVQLFNERPVVRFNYCPTPELPFDYTWDSGNNLQDSNVQNPYAFVPRSIDYAVYTVGRNGCRVRDSLHIFVPDHKLNVGPIDTIACVNQIVPLYATGGDAYNWFEIKNGAFTDASATLSCTNCSDPIATPPVTTTYAVVFSNNVHATNPINPTYETGCPDTMQVTVYVNPLPIVRVVNTDTMIKYGKSLQLYAHGAQTYSWTPVGSLTDPNSPNPMAAPRETTTYIVFGMDTNGCVSTDTVKVAVDYRDNLLVPTGFTPNGDGMNDIFRPVNLGLRSLMEFRVFNRWGQEVFSTTNAERGWDGKWKGIEQQIGSYQYLIKVGYPDDHQETYKGDVTLIR